MFLSDILCLILSLFKRILGGILNVDEVFHD